MIVEKTWTELKALVLTKKLYLQYEVVNNKYHIWGTDNGDVYKCLIHKAATAPTGSDQEEFEDDYKDSCNQPSHPVDDEGRTFARAESKPTTMTTYFAGAGDTSTEIGGGDMLVFDFNEDTTDADDAPTGFRRKRVCVTFIDTVRLKEGTLYWENAPFGSYVDLCLGVPDWDDDPTKGWYLKNDGTPAQNKTGQPIPMAKFVKSTPMMGSCAMGDEMNTEAASNDIPAGIIFGFEVTVPDSVTTSSDCHGAIVIELYRNRTVILE